MIILDFNQVFISNMMMHIKNNDDIQEDLVRHMILNSIKKYRKKFGKKYGELIIACDDKNYWRKTMFPPYKASRKKHQEKSSLDWGKIFNTLNTIKSEIREIFPYKVIQIDSAEADDIIATLIMHESSEIINNNNRILILSGDKDFIQLHKYPNVEQYDPVRDRMIKHGNPEEYLKEHILRGDSGDGVPNFLSEDRCFIDGTRQKRITSKKLDVWLKMEPAEFCDEGMMEKYNRNQSLIDLSKIPSKIYNEVIVEYNKENKKDRSRIFNYFVKNKLKNLMESIQDF